ncbi:hypothetical protein I79_014613 [Cricetulus griseus]|uniref:Uncharacterized protein n=1 Tax=Cricetulus griseus TaxID=10029 RepID=G3HUK1_CRIGR|nr:hypothetical protein I79_014613 [Cricetulus griseus]
MEDNGADNDLWCLGLDQDVSEEKNFSMWPKNCSCDILVKNVVAFCPCLKSLSEAKVENTKYGQPKGHFFPFRNCTILHFVHL